MSVDTILMESYWRQLVDCTDHVSAAIAHAALTRDPLELEMLAIQLDGTRRLAMRLRSAVLAAPAGAEKPSTLSAYPDQEEAA